jgi:hypothetical protein
MTGRGEVRDTDRPADEGCDAGHRDERRHPRAEPAQPPCLARLKRGRRPSRSELGIHGLVQQLLHALVDVVHS